MIEKIKFCRRGDDGLLAAGNAEGVAVSGKDEQSVLAELMDAGFEPAPSFGSRERFSRLGVLFERESCFLSDGEFYMTLKEAIHEI